MVGIDPKNGSSAAVMGSISPDDGGVGVFGGGNGDRGQPECGPKMWERRLRHQLSMVPVGSVDDGGDYGGDGADDWIGSARIGSEQWRPESFKCSQAEIPATKTVGVGGVRFAVTWQSHRCLGWRCLRRRSVAAHQLRP